MRISETIEGIERCRISETLLLSGISKSEKQNSLETLHIKDKLISGP